MQPLLHILKLSLSTSAIPSEWAVAWCVPIFKGGNWKDLDNYRLISILPVFFLKFSIRLSTFNCTTTWKITSSCLITSPLSGRITHQSWQLFISWKLLERAWITASSWGLVYRSSKSTQHRRPPIPAFKATLLWHWEYQSKMDSWLSLAQIPNCQLRKGKV